MKIIDRSIQAPPDARGPETTLHLCERSCLALVPRPARIYQLDGPAAAAALALQDGQSKDSVAEWVGRQAGIGAREGRKLVDEIACALWPCAAQSQGTSADADTAGVLPWRPTDRRAGRTVATRQYRVLDSRFLCRFEDEGLAQSAGEAFAHLEHPGPGPITAAFEIGLADGQIQILRDGQRLDEMAAPDMLVNLLRLVLADTSFAASSDEWAVHAAAVARGAHAVLLPGPAGRGKSTLALGLGAAGYTVLGDDTVVLAGETLELRPLPFPLSVKSGSWGLARTLLGASIPFVPGRRMDGMSVHWLPRSAGIALASPDFRAAAHHIVFPAFTEDAPFQMRQLDCDETLRHLVPGLHALGSGLAPDRIDRLIAWVKGRACYEIRYSRADDAVAFVNGLLS